MGPLVREIQLLKTKGAEVIYNDPFVPELREDNATMTSITLDESALQQTDCVVIAAAHNAYDWDWIIKNSRLIVDTRNATRNIKTPQGRVVKL